MRCFAPDQDTQTMTDKKQMIILAVLLTILGLSLDKGKISDLFKDGTDLTVSIEPNKTVENNVNSPIKPAVFWPTPEPVSEITNDPMLLNVHPISEPNLSAQAVTPGTPTPDKDQNPALQVKGIVYSREGDSLVILEQGIFKQGDQVGNTVITRIEPHHIVVNNQGNLYHIAVGQGHGILLPQFNEHK